MLIFSLGLLASYVALCYVLARNYVSPRQRAPDAADGLARVDILTAVGAVPAWSTPGLAGNPSSMVSGRAVFVLAHGYGGSRSGYADLAKALLARGYESVAPSMPAHDDSPDGVCGFGVKESQLVLDTVAWVRKRSVVPPRIVLYGVSMGGAAAWLASEKDPSVDAVVTEGAFADLDETTDQWLSLVLPGGRNLLRPVRWMATSMCGVNPASVRPELAAAKWKGRPALVIHCEADRLMPERNAKRLAEAAGCEIWRIPGADHAQGFGVATGAYVERLVDLAKSLGP